MMRAPNRRRAFTLVEMMIALILVSITLVAALNTVGASKLGLSKTADFQRGHLLAQDLMVEILQQDYADWIDGLDSFGLKAAEAASGTRQLFNDVDDYHNWSATPPQYKDGTPMSDLSTWTRGVRVMWVNPDIPEQMAVINPGSKSITVTVMHSGVQVAELTAIRTEGLPPTEACCFSTGTCDDLRTELCVAQGGTTQGPDTQCIILTCSATTILLVVTDPAALTAGESARKTLIESWGYRVATIAASDSQAAFDAATATSDAAYIPAGITSADLGTKLLDASIGVVNEHSSQAWALQLSSGTIFTMVSSNITVLDNAHYITSVFNLGTLNILGSAQSLVVFGSQIAPGAQALSEVAHNSPTLMVAEAGVEMADGSSAAERRVELPWGDATFDLSTLTADGQTIMKRSIEWVAKACGDGVCDLGEECVCVADCGVPAAFEQPGVTCADGFDNDCDGATDCADINCPADPACLVPVCGDSLCAPGEDCNSCAADCAGVTMGKPSKRYCCGNGTLESAEGDGTICDGNP